MRKLAKIYALTIITIFGISKINAQIITTVAGCGSCGSALGDGGPATAGQIGIIGSLDIDRNGNMYIASGNLQRIRRVDAITGIITTVAGTGVIGYNGDGIPATTAQLNLPGFINLDTSGNVVIGDGNNLRIRKVNNSSGLINTFMGTGIRAYSPDGTPATSASILNDIFITDRLGTFYFIDQDTLRSHIRKIDTFGNLFTIAGAGPLGCSGDGGPATAATIYAEFQMCTDKNRNLYFADNRHKCVRKIDISTGIITKVAGAGDSIGMPYSGDGGPAISAHINPEGIAVDSIGNLYISDALNHRIEKVDTFGIINSIAGTGIAGFSGDNGLAMTAQFWYPENLAFDPCGNLYVADFNNKRVRKITLNTSVTSTPVIAITSGTSDTICSGTAVTYTASLTGGGTTFAYQWRLNGVTVSGATSSTYTYVPANGDSINCTVTTSNACSSPATASSNTIHTVVNPLLTPSISITSSPGDTVCAGTLITFTTTITGGGTSPLYQWRVNGFNVGTGSTYSYLPTNGDAVQCILTSNAPCVTSATINSNIHHMVIYPVDVPTISIFATPNDTICAGIAVNFTATIATGGSTPAYQWKVNGTNAGASLPNYAYLPSAGDSVRCILTSSAPCASPLVVSSNTIYMVVDTITVPTITLSGPIAAAIGSTVTISATVTGAGSTYTIYWMNQGAVFTTTTVPSVSYTKVSDTDTITAKIVPTGGCYDSTISIAQIVFNTNVGINDLYSQSAIELYPNPAGEVLNIKSAGIVRSVVITNLLGQVVYSNEKDTLEGGIDIHQFSKGVYFIRINEGRVMRFVKE